MALIDTGLWREAGHPRLGDLALGQDNNLNLLRALAATGVLVSHAWPIALGTGATEPLEALTGFSLGGLCVMLFFAVSGFLIAGSWERRPDPRRFVLARALRLMPALVVSLLVVALAMGPLVTGRGVLDYAADPAVRSFLLRNLTLLSPQYTLPGMFESNPFPKVEGSIWTLFHEVLCYAALLAAGLLGLLAPRRLPFALGALALLWLALVPVEFEGVLFRLNGLHDLVPGFAAGVALWHLRHRVPLSGWGALAGIALALAGSQADPAGPGGPLSRLLWTGALAYGALWAAYVPSGAVRGFNAFGDYSYGLYVYAFPVQGFMVWWLGPQTPLANVVLSLPPTLALAMLSWHLVERPSLGLLSRRPGARAGAAPAAA